MIKKILIISSDYTGHGHKSITESLCEEFAKVGDIEVHVVDGFTLGGTSLIKVGKSYGPITRKAEPLWELVWDVSKQRPDLINEMTEVNIRKKFLMVVNQIQPDLILTVHPNFNGSIMNIMEKYYLHIPVVTLIADLVSISPLWADSRITKCLCPSIESKERCLEFGVPEEKLQVVGFPVRSRFYKKQVDEKMKDFSQEPFSCLIMSGGEGVGNMQRIATILLKNFNCKVKIIAGRNVRLKAKLEMELGSKFGDRAEIYGYTNNVQDLMQACDVAITRGSPNVMMESVACNVPLIITGALPGQEEENPAYMEKYHLGMVCKGAKGVKGATEKLMADNAKELRKIQEAQRAFTNVDTVKEIVQHILSIDCAKAKEEYIANKKELNVSLTKI